MAKFKPTPPRYDDVFFEGLAHLNRIASGEYDMTIECYYSECPKHSNHYEMEGPFCDEQKCIMDEWPDNCTCRNCSQKFTCKFAGDLYNTDLDCLMDK